MWKVEGEREFDASGLSRGEDESARRKAVGLVELYVRNCRLAETFLEVRFDFVPSFQRPEVTTEDEDIAEPAIRKEEVGDSGTVPFSYCGGKEGKPAVGGSKHFESGHGEGGEYEGLPTDRWVLIAL